MNAYYRGSLTQSPAREIIECDLMEAFNWLPQDIAKIPYKSLQMMFLIRREKQAAIETKAAVERVKAENSPSSSSGQGKRYRTL